MVIEGRMLRRRPGWFAGARHLRAEAGSDKE